VSYSNTNEAIHQLGSGCHETGLLAQVSPRP
jgi:hypothetical protein